MSGEWPPEWDDPDEGLPSDGDQPDQEAESRLSEVSASLAAVPAPVMPDAVASRISVALAAEATRRRADEARTLDYTSRQARVRRRQQIIRRSLQVTGALAVCLVFVGFGFLVSHGSSQSSSSAASAAGASSSADSGAVPAAEPTGGKYGYSAAAGTGVNPGATFTVTESGTEYRRASLAGQVRAANAVVPGGSGTTAEPGTANSSSAASTSVSNPAASSATPTSQTPSAALVGCVLHFTGGAAPKLVDRATYQGTPAYVIASSSRVWVVGLGCTSTNPELIVSVPLAGLSGNLRALVSVKR
jgi:hypothetical protein